MGDPMNKCSESSGSASMILRLTSTAKAPQGIQGTFHAPCCTPPGRLGPPPLGRPPTACETSEVAGAAFRIDAAKAGFAGFWLVGGLVFLQR